VDDRLDVLLSGVGEQSGQGITPGVSLPRGGREGEGGEGGEGGGELAPVARRKKAVGVAMFGPRIPRTLIALRRLQSSRVMGSNWDVVVSDWLQRQVEGSSATRPRYGSFEKWVTHARTDTSTG